MLIHYRQDMVPRLLSDSVCMLAVGAIYICIRLMNSVVLGSPPIASCIYPLPMLHVSVQPNVLLKEKENHLLQETPTTVYKLILAALMAEQFLLSIRTCF